MRTGRRGVGTSRRRLALGPASAPEPWLGEAGPLLDGDEQGQVEQDHDEHDDQLERFAEDHPNSLQHVRRFGQGGAAYADSVAEPGRGRKFRGYASGSAGVAAPALTILSWPSKK